MATRLESPVYVLLPAPGQDRDPVVFANAGDAVAAYRDDYPVWQMPLEAEFWTEVA